MFITIIQRDKIIIIAAQVMHGPQKFTVGIECGVGWALHPGSSHTILGFGNSMRLKENRI